MNSGNDIDNIMAIKNLLSTVSNNNSEDKNSEEGSLTDILNAAVPFMTGDKRRLFFYFTKIMEIMDYRNEVSAFERVADKRTRREQFLKSVGPFLSDADKSSLDTLIKVIELKKLMG